MTVEEFGRVRIESPGVVCYVGGKGEKVVIHAEIKKEEDGVWIRPLGTGQHRFVSRKRIVRFGEFPPPPKLVKRKKVYGSYS